MPAGAATKKERNVSLPPINDRRQTRSASRRAARIRADNANLRDLIAAAPGGETFSRFVALAELAIELTESGATSGDPIEAAEEDVARETAMRRPRARGSAASRARGKRRWKP